MIFVNTFGLALRCITFLLPMHWKGRLRAHPYARLAPGEWIWIHAVSVGELLLIPVFLDRLLQLNRPIHITTSTPAGQQLLKKILNQWNSDHTITGSYFPLDDMIGVNAFLSRRPKIILLMETEIWPYLTFKARNLGIVIGIINGRLTQKSLGWRGHFLKSTVEKFNFIVARDHHSVKLFKAQGAPQSFYGGNLKAESGILSPLEGSWQGVRAAWASSPVLVIGNTVDGEESYLASCYAHLKKIIPNLKCILAPRQPDRFREVARLLNSQRINFTLASDIKSFRSPQWSTIDFVLLDTIGDLAPLYQVATIALVGGGWRSNWGHNPLEPLRYGKLTIIGPGYDNFQDIVEPLLSTSDLKVIGLEVLESNLHKYLLHPPLPDPFLLETIAKLGGAKERLWKVVDPYLR